MLSVSALDLGEVDFSNKHNRIKLIKLLYKLLKKNKSILKFPVVKVLSIDNRETVEFSEEYQKFISDSEKVYNKNGVLVAYRKCYVPIDDSDLPLRRLGVEICAVTKITGKKPRNYVIIKRGKKQSSIECIHPVLITMKYDRETDTFYEVEQSEEKIKEVELTYEDYYYVIRSFVEFLVENGVLNILKNSYESPNSIPMDRTLRHQLTTALIDIAPEVTMDLLLEVIKLFVISSYREEYIEKVYELLSYNYDFFNLKYIKKLLKIIDINRVVQLAIDTGKEPYINILRFFIQVSFKNNYTDIMRYFNIDTLVDYPSLCNIVYTIINQNLNNKEYITGLLERHEHNFISFMSKLFNCINDRRLIFVDKIIEYRITFELTDSDIKKIPDIVNTTNNRVFRLLYIIIAGCINLPEDMMIYILKSVKDDRGYDVRYYFSRRYCSVPLKVGEIICETSIKKNEYSILYFISRSRYFPIEILYKLLYYNELEIIGDAVDTILHRENLIVRGANISLDEIFRTIKRFVDKFSKYCDLNYIHIDINNAISKLSSVLNIPYSVLFNISNNNISLYYDNNNNTLNINYESNNKINNFKIKLLPDIQYYSYGVTAETEFSHSVKIHIKNIRNIEIADKKAGNGEKIFDLDYFFTYNVSGFKVTYIINISFENYKITDLSFLSLSMSISFLYNIREKRLL